MAEKRFVEQITPRDADFAQWYTDVVKKAELIDYTSVKGCVVLRPYAYAIWEGIQRILDGMFKATGHENVYMPLLIPESLLNKEKEHVEGFAPEVAWVTHGGSERLEERLCIRPTSETLFCEHYAHVISSWRDLPKLYNQWCSVFRWEKSTRPFLRSREFLWQEGHTAHADEAGAREEALRMLDAYAELAERHLAMPVLKGRKTDAEKFAGAVETYAIEAMMHDGQALQAGTSHYLGDGFARAFSIQYSDAGNAQRHVHQTSWGVSTRLIGGIIMAHGDDSGLRLPPAIAPVQVAVIPISPQKEGVAQAARDLADRLSRAGLRVKVDESDQSAGWKFAEHEMRGVPLRCEVGPRDLEKGVCLMVRRDTGEKAEVPLSGVEGSAAGLLAAVRDGLYAEAKERLESRIRDAFHLDEMKAIAAAQPGFLRTMWCGDASCEEAVRAATGMKSRCMPFDQTPIGGRCPVCSGKADRLIYWGLQY
ncbi:MAG: proline--tRNA ligase [Oscillospiraceae bacterium]|nr:proline--tRNA ligase [Oscillospiraceae bacterium]